MSNSRSNVPSLKQLAQNACMKQVRYIFDFGDCPVDLIRPIITAINNAEQLHTVEQNSPHIIGHDADVWCRLIKRDAPQFDVNQHTPKDPAKWWKVYRKLVGETQARAEEQRLILADQLGRRRQERVETGVGILDRIVVPRKARRVTDSGPRLSGGKALLHKVRKEASEHRKFKQVASSARSLPHLQMNRSAVNPNISPTNSLPASAKQTSQTSARPVQTDSRVTSRPQPPRDTSSVFAPAKKRRRN